jgi:hypothetical protein
VHNTRRGHDAAHKAKVVLETVKGEKPLARLLVRLVSTRTRSVIRSISIMVKDIEAAKLLQTHYLKRGNPSSLMTYDAVEKNKTGNRNIR